MWIVGTLLGPERTAVLVVSFFRSVLRHTADWCWWVAGVGPGFGCSLRTVQWTRASLWSSYEEHMVDALAPGADEGRRRLR